MFVRLFILSLQWQPKKVFKIDDVFKNVRMQQQVSKKDATNLLNLSEKLHFWRQNVLFWLSIHDKF